MTMKVTKAGYREGQRLFQDGGTLRDLSTKMFAMHEQAQNWQPPEGEPNAQPPDFESESFSLMIGFGDGFLNRMRGLR